jgi:uncharacterized membrane protein
MGIGPYSYPDLGFILLVNVLPVPVAFVSSHTPMQFVVRLLLAMAAGFGVWVMGMLLVAWTQFRRRPSRQVGGGDR